MVKAGGAAGALVFVDVRRVIESGAARSVLGLVAREGQAEVPAACSVEIRARVGAGSEGDTAEEIWTMMSVRRVNADV